MDSRLKMIDRILASRFWRITIVVIAVFVGINTVLNAVSLYDRRSIRDELQVKQEMLDARAEAHQRTWDALDRAGLLTDEDKQRFNELKKEAGYK